MSEVECRNVRSMEIKDGAGEVPAPSLMNLKLVGVGLCTLCKLICRRALHSALSLSAAASALPVATLAVALYIAVFDGAGGFLDLCPE